jgi:hypothetical protein
VVPNEADKLDKVKEESNSSSEYYDSEEEIIEERN